MKINFLSGNSPPRGMSEFLKMMVTVTALLCIHLFVYAQPTQTKPFDGTNVPIPVKLEWETSSVSDTEIEIYLCSTSEPPSNTVDLGAYELLCTKTITDENEDNLTGLSGITYNEETNTLFIIRNSSDVRAIYETSLSGELLRTIDISSQFEGTEGIVHLEGTTYAITEERRGNIAIIDISTSLISYSNSHIAELPDDLSWDNNAGLEGVSYNPADNRIHTVKEGDLEINPRPWNEDRDYYSFIRHTSDEMLQMTDLTEPCDVSALPFDNFIDLSGIHHLGLTDGVHHLGVEGHSLMLSDASKTLIEIDENCNERSRIDLSSIEQPEGVTMDNDGNLYIISEPNSLHIFSKPHDDGRIYGDIVSGNTHIPETTGLDAGNTYCWRIKSEDECTWSPIWSFTICADDTDNDGVCDVDDICSNLDDALIGTVCNDGNDCTQEDVYTSDCECKGTLIDEDGNGICDTDDCLTDISISTYDVNQTYYEVSNTITTIVDANVAVNNNEQLTLNAGYYIKLRSGFEAKTGSIVRAYIQGCELDDQKVEQTTLASVKHYPNPFKDEVTLEFNLDFDAETQIIVSDVNGRTMSQIPVENLYQGIQTIGLSTQSWIPGIYFYQVQIKAQNTGIISHANGTLVKM